MSIGIKELRHELEKARRQKQRGEADRDGAYNTWAGEAKAQLLERLIRQARLKRRYK